MKNKYLYLALPLLLIAGCGKRLPTVVQQTANSVPRRVVMELFTATWCTNCPTADAALEGLAEEMGDSITVIEYHPLTGTPLDLFGNAESEARGQFYGVNAWPTLWCDGLTSQIGTTADTYHSYSVLAHNRLLLNSILKIDLDARLDKGLLEYTASVQTLSAPALSDPRLLVVVLEDSIYYSAPNGSTLHRFVCRDMEPDALGAPITLVAGNTVFKQGTLAIDTIKWRQDRLWVAAFVQDKLSKEIVQSDFVNLSEPVWDFTLSSNDTLKTAGLDSTAVYSFKIKNTGNQPDTFWLDLPDSLSLPADLSRSLKDGTGLALSLPYPLALNPGDSTINYTVELKSPTAGDYQAALTARSGQQPTNVKKLNFYLEVVISVLVDFSITASDTLKNALVGVVAEYPIIVSNTGNVADSVWLDIPDSLISSDSVAPALCDSRGVCYPVPFPLYLPVGGSETNLVVHLTGLAVGTYEVSLTLTAKSYPMLFRRLRLYLEVKK